MIIIVLDTRITNHSVSCAYLYSALNDMWIYLIITDLTSPQHKLLEQNTTVNIKYRLYKYITIVHNMS